MLKAALLAIVAIGLIRVFLLPESDNPIIEFQYGVLTGLGIVTGRRLSHYRKVRRSEQLMKEEYNQDQDERLKAIRAKAGLPFTIFTSVTMLIAGSVIGYFNMTVFYALTGAALLQILASGMMKLYYKQTM